MAGSPEYLELLKSYERQTIFMDNSDAAWEFLDWSWFWFEKAQTEVTLKRVAEICLVILENESDRTRSEILDHAAKLHIAKNAGYAGHTPDPWSNFRLATKFGVTAAQGVSVRMSDKYSRILSLRKNPDNDQVGESILDTVRDLFAYALIELCILREATNGNTA